MELTPEPSAARSEAGRPVARTRVLVVDDHEVVRRGLMTLIDLEETMETVGEASCGQDGIDLAVSLAPDVVLMDVQLPDIDGITAARTIIESTRCKVVMLTALADEEVVYGGLRAGVSGFLLKVAPSHELVETVALAAQGKAHLHADVTGLVIDRFTSAPETRLRDDLVGSLTDREREVLVALAEGQSNTEIAESLHLSETTVKSHISHIFTKTGARDRAQAVGIAYESGLVTPGM